MRILQLPHRSAPVMGWAIKLVAAAGFALPLSVSAQSATDEVTFHKDITPILQRSCQSCHRPEGVAPMSLVSYDEVVPYAGLIEYRTHLRDRAGAMPPWYAEKDVGIQDYKQDPSLTDEELAKISSWARNGVPEGDAADAPAPLVFDDATRWTAGEPDLIVRTEDITVEGGAPDWWGDIPSIPTGLTEDRYVKSVEIREVNDLDMVAAGGTVGGRNIVHHMIWSTQVFNEDGTAEGIQVPWPVHEIARNPDIFDQDGGRLLRANSHVVSNSVHLHSTGIDTTGHLEIGFRFHPVGYEPKYRPVSIGLGNGVDISITGNQDNQQLHAYAVLDQPTKIVTFEPHLHAPGERMCLEAIWGYTVETLSCVGYDHNWVRGYTFGEDSAPLLPEGTVLHITGYMNNTDTNSNVPDSRNWQGSGNRSVTNMFIDLGMRVGMTEDQFLEEMTNRRKNLDLGPNDHVIGCPLCLAPLVAPIELTDEEKEEMSEAMINYLTVTDDEKEKMPEAMISRAEVE
jgi:mono/diheme cytochrome c family protein